MLKLKPNCECCDRDLPPSARDAMICTFECAFCRHCIETKLNSVCPNCVGDFTTRPLRPVNWLAKYPAVAAGIHKPEGGAARVT